ncbi:MAG: hypothetical protein U0893_28505 [Chloroflexota bacterium]
MSVTPETEWQRRDGQVAPAEDGGPLPGSPLPPAPQAPAETSDGVSERVRARRRARRRTRLRQAIGARRSSATSWATTLGRRWIGLAVLVLVAGAAWVEVVLTHQSSAAADRAAGGTTVADRAVATATPAPAPDDETADAELEPTPISTPPTARELLPGPEISSSLIEANGPILGCTFHPRLDELRARIGGELVGFCIDVPQVEPSGNARQRTTRGELFWNEAERRVAFTDGAHTWLNGPSGIVRRRNEERFEWERDAAAGPRPATTTRVLPPPLPGAILPTRRIVSYYGNPLASGMGVLGEQPPEKLFPRLRDQAEAYASADKRRGVAPALELVAVVAQGEPGPDGLYRLRMETELIDRVLGWADAHGFLLILDVQIGRGSVDDEVRWLLPYLKRPNVHLALDPEFAMPAGQVPGQRIGTMDAAAIDGAQRTLAELVEREKLPPKVLAVHRFTPEMVTNAHKISTDPRVQVVMVMDGFGGPSTKSRQYDELIAEPRVQYTGFKLFYRHDEPLMTPEQVLLLEPAPDLIVYQ